jgi:hypothetical protein
MGPHMQRQLYQIPAECFRTKGTLDRIKILQQVVLKLSAHFSNPQNM